MAEIFKDGTKVKYTGKTNGAYTNGKVYVIEGYDDEMEVYGVPSDLGETYCVAPENLEEVK